jgi:hypothetical protein
VVSYGGQNLVRFLVSKKEILQRPWRRPYCRSRELVSSEEAVLDDVDRFVNEGKYEKVASEYEELCTSDKENEIRELNI